MLKKVILGLLLTIFISRKGFSTENTGVYEKISKINQFKFESTLGLPLPVLFGVSTNLGSSVETYLHLGYFYLPLGGNIQSLSLLDFQLGVRYNLLQSRFWFVLASGVRRWKATANLGLFKVDDEVLATSSSMTLNAAYIFPALEYQFELRPKWTFAWNLGLQIPFFSNGSLKLYNNLNGTNSSNSDILRVNDQKAMAHIASYPFPVIGLFSVRYGL